MTLRATIPMLALSALTACAASTPSADGLRLAPPDAALTAPCGGPRPIPVGIDAVTQEAIWRADRIALVACRDRHAALTAWAQGVVEAVGR